MDGQDAIGVFDSGVGGLTVLRALKAILPNENFIYLGDTARLPYGTKSKDTVVNYSLQNAKLLIDQNIKMLVIACNTASSVALTELRQCYSHIPIVGVLEPGAQAAVAATRNHNIVVLATETTIQEGGYQDAIKRLSPNANLFTQSCGLLVALAEEGWVENDVAHSALKEYLRPILEKEALYDCLVLGCTHFPVFKNIIRELLSDAFTIIDSAQATAAVVVSMLERFNLKSFVSHPGVMTFLVTDSPNRFSRIGELFLGEKVEQGSIILVDHHLPNRHDFNQKSAHP